MWKIYYYPPSGENNSPYEEIIKLGTPLSVHVFYQLELNAVFETTEEWTGSVKSIKYRKEKWLQWTWKQIRIHFILLHKNKSIVILHVFLKKSDQTKKVDLERTYMNMLKFGMGKQG